MIHNIPEVHTLLQNDDNFCRLFKNINIFYIIPSSPFDCHLVVDNLTVVSLVVDNLAVVSLAVDKIAIVSLAVDKISC